MVFIPGPGPGAFSPSVAPAGTGPNLTAAERQVERLMDDACRIEQNMGGDVDAVLDQVTGELVQPAPVTVYVGKCTITGGGGASVTEEGGQLLARDPYQVQLPLSWLRAHPDQEPQVGMTLLVTSARRDPRLVGRQFDITDVEAKTFSVSRRCTLSFPEDG